MCIRDRAQTAAPVARLFMFTYPRVLGYVFNPLTVYYGFDASERLCLMVYEVNNTFGERHTYVLPVEGPGQQQCRKQLYVSPFNRVEGTYHFTISPPADTLNLAIALTTGDGPCMSAWFNGDRVPLTDLSLLRSFCSLPLQPLRVIAGIHAQAARLWLKGLRVKPRPPPPAESISFKSSEHLP